MKRGLFSGWKDVYSFTFKQTANEKYRKSTAIIAVILLLAAAAVSIVMAFVQKRDDAYISPIETVYVVDDSGFGSLYLEGFALQEKDTYPEVQLEVTDKTIEQLAAKLSEESHSAILHLEKQEDNAYLVSVLIPSEGELSQNDGEMLAEEMISVMQQSKLISLNISMDKLVIALSPVAAETVVAGEEGKSIGEELVQMLLPMVIMLFLYLLVLMYGLTMGNVVSIEKSSKLMEMILTLTKPYGLILGKVLAVSVSAIIQIVLWIGVFVGGFFLGDFVADKILYPGYTNYVLETFELLGSRNAQSAFSVPALLMALAAFIAGFILFSAVAAMVASFASKAEDLATVMNYYQILMVAAFFAAYMLPMQEKEWINTILRVIPFTSAFMLPGDLIVGRITLLQGGLYGLILVATVLVMCYFAGVEYKNQIFNKGKLKSPIARKRKF